MKPFRSLPLILLFLQVGVFCSIGQGIRSRVRLLWFAERRRRRCNPPRPTVRRLWGTFSCRQGDVENRPRPNPPQNSRSDLRFEWPADFRLRGGGRRILLQELAGNRARSAGGGAAIRITEARYGARGRYSDVTDRVRALARRRQSFTVSNKTFGMDPYPGRKKWLEITYLRGRTSRTQKYSEGVQGPAQIVPVAAHACQS